jgi:hypothetical protein
LAEHTVAASGGTRALASASGVVRHQGRSNAVAVEAMGWGHTLAAVVVEASSPSGDGGWRCWAGRWPHAVVAGSCGSRGGGGSYRVKMGRGRRKNGSANEGKWKVQEGGKRKRIRRFLYPLMFIGCHITNEHKQTAPCVPCSLMFVDLVTSLMNISGQCHVRYRPVICSSVMCQTNKYTVSLSVLKTDE